MPINICERKAENGMGGILEEMVPSSGSQKQKVTSEGKGRNTSNSENANAYDQCTNSS